MGIVFWFGMYLSEINEMGLSMNDMTYFEWWDMKEGKGYNVKGVNL